MDKFALLPAAERAVYFETTAANLGILPELVEKDFWVCWTLMQMFSLEGIGAHITFKGGTSLSKCYSVIQRFSEDIDIAIERKYLEHGKNLEPSIDESNKENQKRIDALMTSARAAIRHKILPEFRQKVTGILGSNNKWTIELDPDDHLQQTILFMFPPAVTKTVHDYVMPAVKIELGARSDHWPAESLQILPYVAELLRDDLTVNPTIVRVLSAQRTFWEKAMILHRLYHSPDDKAVSKRMSRHYYDLYQLGKAGIFEKALEHDDIMQSVISFNRLFFKYSWMDYDEAKRGSFRLVPRDAKRLQNLKADYRLMEPMFFKDPPTFDQIVSGLQAMEARINKVDL